MSNNILLCDIGGTHVRFAKHESKGAYSNFKKYVLNDFDNFEEVIHHYIHETGLTFNAARFSTALVPEDGKFNYRRFDGEQNFNIDFNSLKSQFGWTEFTHFMDGEAAGNALPLLSNDDTTQIIPAKSKTINDKKILIGVGTGIFHALVDGHTITRYTDGHVLPTTVTQDHRTVEAYIRKRKNNDLCLIMEDFVSGRGLKMITTALTGDNVENMCHDDFSKHLKSRPEVIRVFFELLGIYTHNAVTNSGFYGGVYFTGGVMDALIENDLTDWDSFYEFYCPPMVSVVIKRLQSASINRVHHQELPLLGLTNL